MTDTLVICQSCGDSVKADEFEPGVSLICEDCDPKGQDDAPPDLAAAGDEVWHDYELGRWPSNCRPRR
ncbi:MAG: hypothetical protein QGH45_05680 [Myxococcota bacterium]|jgi:hypothetical protein|nr:hypothetical protein [Myxococcota bacterium]